VAASDKTSAKANGKDANKRGGRGTNTRRRNAAAFIKAKVQSALKKRAKEKITVSTFIAQNHHIFFAAGFCLLAIFVAALMKVKDISPGALRKEIAAYKSQNSVLKNEVNLVHQVGTPPHGARQFCSRSHAHFTLIGLLSPGKRSALQSNTNITQPLNASE